MKLYMTGVTGFVGSGFLKVALERYGAEVFAACHETYPKGRDKLSAAKVNLKSSREVLESVRAFEPDAIVHLAILGDFQTMYAERRRAWDAYVKATEHLVSAANEVGAKFVLISTDWVFDGQQAEAEETTPPNPINYYGLLKVVCETIVRCSADDGAVARIAGLFGVHWERDDWRPQPNAGFGFLPNAVVEALERQERFELPYGPDLNIKATPTLTTEAAEMVMKLVQQDRRGLFHCVGRQGIGKLELCRATAEVFGFDPGRVVAVPPDPEDPANLHGIPVPQDTRLSVSATAAQLGHEPLTVPEALEVFKRQLESGRLA